jgi:hypothetical protein
MDNLINAAKQKLQETDWIMLQDVSEVLSNKEEFVQYRFRLRHIVINNTKFGSLPTEPTPIWSTPPQEQ